MTRSRSVVPSGNPSVGREECAMGIVMDGAGVRPSGLLMCISCGFWFFSTAYSVKSPNLQAKETGYLYLHKGTSRRTKDYGKWTDLHGGHPSVVLDNAVVHMHLLVAASACR